MRFEVTEGQLRNLFLKRPDGRAAHVILRSGCAPRIVIAFPGGNMGMGLWFAETATPVELTFAEVAALPDGDGQAVKLQLEVQGDAGAELVQQTALLGNIRHIRELMYRPDPDAPMTCDATLFDGGCHWARAPDNAPDAMLSLRSEQIEQDRLVLDAQGQAALQVSAATSAPPLATVPGGSVLKPDWIPAEGSPLQPLAQLLDYMYFADKWLAGSWQYCTYFGRDTLMSLALLLPALTDQAIGAALRSVLSRLAADGAVAHEEALGEYALTSRQQEQPETDDASSLFDYQMIDDDCLLLPVLELVGQQIGTDRLADLLTAHEWEAVARNAALILQIAKPFTDDPHWHNLHALKPGHVVGEWRDSRDGLGGGRIPYSVNAVLIPAALSAIETLASLDLLPACLVAEATRYKAIWQTQAPSPFQITIPADQANRATDKLAAQFGLPSPSEPFDRPLSFPALALDGEGKPITVLHSDEGFRLFFDAPAPAELEQLVTRCLAEFPRGLLSPVGLMIANPAFADEQVQARFSPNHYHGMVIWSWQQALFAAGLRRQRLRDDLPVGTQTLLAEAESRLWQVIRNSRKQANSELWGWSYLQKSWHARPFGQNTGDHAESNVAQLWSTVWLALTDPRQQKRNP